jgi:NAD(P)-dependent dehydrogenase (short-subunit alcohol dehydrogenase family)
MTEQQTVAVGEREGIAVRDTAIVTGSSSGIGLATAKALYQDGWRVYATARDPEIVQKLDDAGFEADRLDVTDGSQARAVVDRAIEETGGIDCLVNNAGFAQLGPIEDVSTARVRRQFDVNVFGPHRLARAALPHMRERGEGTIVNVSSAAGLVPFPGGGVYSGAEHALEAMTDALRSEVSGLGIDVVLVEPGPVETEFADRAERELRGIEWSEDYGPFYEFYDDTQTIGGFGAAVGPEEVAATILYAATCVDPDPRYRVGTLAKVAGYASHLPATWQDRVYGLIAWITS